MEQQPDSAGVSRGQNQLHIGPEDASAAATMMQPLLDRIDPDTAAAQVLVVTSDEDATAAIAGRLVHRVASAVRVLAATESRRSARVLRSAPAHVVLAPAPTLVSLMRAAVLKVDPVRAVVLAWVDEQGPAAMQALETLMGEVPKDAARFVLAAAATPTVDQLVERYARRARRLQPAAADVPAVSLSYVTTSETGRLSALRRTLDALDPETAVIVARDAMERAGLEATLRALGYGGDDALVRAVDDPSAAGQAAVTILHELPPSDAELRRLVSGASGRVVALVTPRQVSALRRMAGGSVTPLMLPEAAARARSREESLRDELRAILEAGQYSRELITLEPLLTDFDGAEVAAAALRLLELQRARPVMPGATDAPPLTRLYLNVGAMDEVRPGDLVGAITNEAGISKAELGRVDVRDKHSTVEVATAVANTVVEKLTGVQIRGRRVIARVDEDRPRERRERRDGERRERPDRADRGARPARSGRGDRRGPPRSPPRR